jgi:hypothetical protein
LQRKAKPAGLPADAELSVEQLIGYEFSGTMDGWLNK